MWIGPSPMLSTAEVNPSFVLPPALMTRIPVGACWSRSGSSEPRAGLIVSSTTAPVRACRHRRAEVSSGLLPASVGPHQPDALLAAAVAHEREPTTVGRPVRTAVEPGRGRHPPRWRAVERRDPHVRIAADDAGIGDGVSRRAPRRRPTAGREPRRAPGARRRPRRPPTACSGRLDSTRRRSAFRPATRQARRRSPRRRRAAASGRRRRSSRRGRARRTARSPRRACRPSGDQAGSTSSAAVLPVSRRTVPALVSAT